MNRKRNQMLVHSCCYYLYDDPIISDEQWQVWADELVWLQFVWGWRIGYWHDGLFADWDGSTGMHLTKDKWARATARYLLRICGNEDTLA